MILESGWIRKPVALLFVLSWVALALPARASVAIDTQSAEILKSTFKIYAALTSYQHRETMTFTATVQGQQRRQEFYTTLIFQKPNLLLMQRPGATIVCDGRQFITYYNHPSLRQYTAKPAPKSITGKRMKIALMQDDLELVLTALLAEKAYDTFVRQFKKIEYLKQIEQTGKQYHKLRLSSQRVAWTMLIDAKSMLLTEVSLTPIVPPGGEVTERLVSRYESVRTNQRIDLNRFSVKIDKSARKVSRISFTRNDNYPLVNRSLPGTALAWLAPKTPRNKIVPTEMLGRITFVTFWATWCGPCRIELPELERLYKKYHDRGFNIIAISTDEQSAQDQAKQFVRENKLTYPILWDPDGSYSTLLAVEALPTLLIVDRKGTIIEAHQGLNPRMQIEFGRIIEDALALEDKQKTVKVK